MRSEHLFIYGWEIIWDKLRSYQNKEKDKEAPYGSFLTTAWGLLTQDPSSKVTVVNKLDEELEIVFDVVVAHQLNEKIEGLVYEKATTDKLDEQHEDCYRFC